MNDITIFLLGVIILGAPIFYWGAHSDKTVEKYCSTVYQYNVNDYESCRRLSLVQIVENFTKDFNNKNNKIDLR